MATTIHHGCLGSYKTFACVQRYAIPHLLAGGIVVTNVRGFDSLETVKTAFCNLSYIDKLLNKPIPYFPSSARLYYFPTQTREQCDFFATWYKWLPKGALLIIDEAQKIYPDKSSFKLEHLDKISPPLSGSLPFSLDDFLDIGGRPLDCQNAFDQQRHYNWNIILSTPHIDKIKDDIREVSEWAYRHRSLSEISKLFKNKWIEHQHDADNNGKAESHRQGKPKIYKADKRVFKCYRSTATGEHVASNAGTKLFDDAGIKFKLGISFICLCLFIAFANKSMANLKKQQQPITTEQPTKTPNKPTVVPDKVDTQTKLATDNQTVHHAISATAPVKVAEVPTKHDDVVWRLASIVTNKKTAQKLIYITDNNKHIRRIDTKLCRFDQYGQPSCYIDGSTQPITFYTDLQPTQQQSNKVLLSSNNIFK